MENNNYMVCWTDSDGQKKWEIVPAKDEVQVVSELFYRSPLVFPMSSELDGKTDGGVVTVEAPQHIKTPIGSIAVNQTSDPNYPGVYVSVDDTSLVLVEYDPSQRKHAIRVWSQDEPENDPEYIQMIESRSADH
ncbi:hypothetical protein EHV15_34190 [Paenibacillus oralis]|uniref:Uncharacterized protein n=1 Tax=Paenibacillus oralis TaxID=2490856 RepID=A0A3P3TAV0_9BACL|nr:hypothetical protein [Paenibacillus oralis]RRJ54649.1 hypothetical protein EHV15_34190 [Paenibacillus oralis]